MRGSISVIPVQLQPTIQVLQQIDILTAGILPLEEYIKINGPVTDARLYNFEPYDLNPRLSYAFGYDSKLTYKYSMSIETSSSTLMVASQLKPSTQEPFGQTLFSIFYDRNISTNLFSFPFAARAFGYSPFLYNGNKSEIFLVYSPQSGGTSLLEMYLSYELLRVAYGRVNKNETLLFTKIKVLPLDDYQFLVFATSDK